MYSLFITSQLNINKSKDKKNRIHKISENKSKRFYTKSESVRLSILMKNNHKQRFSKPKKTFRVVKVTIGL